jgi:hypothetical protein
MKPTLRLVAVAALAALTANVFGQEEEAPPVPTPNRIKYTDSKPHAKAAGQFAYVETRALLSRWGEAQLEVTTGDLDTGEPSLTANITKVKLEIGGTTTHFNNLDEGSTFVLPLPGVGRHTPFASHVNVKASTAATPRS